MVRNAEDGIRELAAGGHAVAAGSGVMSTIHKMRLTLPGVMPQ